MTNAEFREVLEDRTAKYAVEVFKYLRERPYDVSTKVIAHQLGKNRGFYETWLKDCDAVKMMV